MRDREHQDALVECARLQAKIEALRETLLNNKEFMGLLRFQAWLKADRSKARLGEDGESLVCPTHWPPGVSPKEYARRYLETSERRQALRAELRELDDDLG